MGKKEKTAQELEKRYAASWRFLTAVLDKPVRYLFNYSYEDFDIGAIEGPVIVIPNHTSAWDSIIMAISMKGKLLHFVMTETMLRKKFIGPLIEWVNGPIPRKKASSGSGTVMACLRQLKAGNSICLFAEGEQSWSGLSIPVFPATGKLSKKSGATLVTYRIEGAYIALPRWASGVRKGKVYGHHINVYSPEMLKSMTADEVTEAIDRDLSFDVWKWQDEQPGGPVRFRSRHKDPAAGLDKSLFICPECGKMCSLTASGNALTCTCGARTIYTETGFLEGGRFRTLAEWDAWQIEELSRRMDAVSSGDSVELFSDANGTLSVVEDGHQDSVIAEGTIRLSVSGTAAILEVGTERFGLADIRMMAPVLSGTLLFSTDQGYFEIKAHDTNIRKYLLVWQCIIDKKNDR